MKRTHSCGILSLKEDKKKVSLIGWAQRIRDHGGKKFIDIRDREGVTQVVFDPDVTKNFAEVENFRREYLIQINGVVRPRPDGTVNPRMKTGEVEVLVNDFVVVNKCDVLPFDIDAEHFKDVNEELRLEYRYLDLRRAEMFDTFKKRHQFIKAIREHLDSQEFIEVETPYLTKSTPEGARDMLVPSRKHEGTFYALPQSPQLFKQLLMVSGFERYYQIARCFRDEDSRKDRQLEFTQMDTEMSFVSFDELREIMEGALIKAMKVYGKDLTHKHFEVMTYDEAIEKYSTDKPDLRIKGLGLATIDDIAKDCGFGVFSSTVKSGNTVKGMRVENGQELYSRKDVDKLIVLCQELGAKGMAWMKVMKGGEVESSITKFFKPEELKSIVDRFKAKEGDYLFFIADKKSVANDVLDGLRRHIAQEKGLINEENDRFVWVTEFPLFQWDDDLNKPDCEHSPFTMPNEEGEKFIDKNIKTREDVLKHKEGLLSLRGDCYDLAMNGIEICSGALRITRPDFQKKIFEIIQMPEETIERQFGWFLKAYNYGAPQHRGLAFGIDRIIMLLSGKESIREVMAFPKNKVGFCPLTKSPSAVDEEQLKELHIKLDVKEKKKD